MRRYDHEPPTGFRYWSRVIGVGIFYAFTIAGGILTVLFLLGYAKP
jgi:hypothetical protein